MTRSDLINWLACPNVQAFLALIREGETNQTPNAYRMQWGSGLFYPEREWKHPNQAITINGITSTAAGAYQFLSKTWLALVEQYGFEDFSPPMQDLGAVALIAERGALEPLKAGNVHEAIARCSRVWASLPGSPYGQPTAKLSRLLAAYTAAGGTVADQSAPKQPEVKPMAPVVIPLLEVISGLIPQLGKLFGSGSEVANRNVAAATLAADAIVKVTNSVNLQEAVEKVQTDPDALNAAKEVVGQLVMQLGEAGGGGIEGARKAAATTEGDWKRAFINVPFAVILMLMPIVYFTIYVVLTQAGWSKEIQASVVSAVISGVLFGITGFALGTTVNSTKKTDALIASTK